MLRLPHRISARLTHRLLVILLILPVSIPSFAAEDALVGADSLDQSGRPLTAAGLLARFEARIRSTPGAGDIAALTSERERLQATGLPNLRFSERSSWNFDELVELGLGASLSWSISDPRREVQEQLVAQRLALAQHNALSRHASQLEEFRRTLRLLAHLEQVEKLLARHREQLLVLRPEWRELEQYALGVSDTGSGFVSGGGQASVTFPEKWGARPVLVAGPRAEQLGFLEVVQALERTRRERSLLLLAVADRAGVDLRHLEGVVLGMPPLPDPAKVMSTCLAPRVVENDETIRAELLLEESRLAAQLDSARALPQVSLDLSSNARYANSSFGSHPWNAGLRLALRVVMPAGAGVGGEISAAVTPSGLSQELSVAWPPTSQSVGPGIAAAERAYRKALNEARFDALSDVKSLHDALDRLRLRSLEITSARRAVSLQGANVALLNEAAQAELALLNAELEVDLAMMEAAAGCG